MDGKMQPQQSLNGTVDDFTAGQMVGMIVMLTFIEKNGEIPEDMVYKLKSKACDGLQEYFDKPSEDIFLMIDNIVDERCVL